MFFLVFVQDCAGLERLSHQIEAFSRAANEVQARYGMSSNAAGQVKLSKTHTCVGHGQSRRVEVLGGKQNRLATDFEER